MADKRATTGAWVAPQPEPVQAPQRQPTYKGETSGLRFMWLFALAFFVALAVAVVAWEVWHMVIVSFSLFAVALLGVFVPVYRWDMEVSTGLRHRRMELRAEDYKSQDALAIANATIMNEEQQAQIAQMKDDILALQQAVESLRTVTITDRSGSRIIPAHDDIDMLIVAWLSQSVFGPDGMLTGVYEKSGVIKGKYPFSAKDERNTAAHQRLVRAGLVDVRQPGNQYVWKGPITLSETRRKLTPTKAKPAD